MAVRSGHKLTDGKEKKKPVPCVGPYIGIDEAGRGCLAGPVVAAAVYFPEHFDFAARLPGLTDSKKLSEDKRNKLAALVEEQALAYGVGLIWQDEIDSINILNATFRAMSRAVFALAAKLSGSAVRDVALPPLLVDGNKTIPEKHWQNCAEGIHLSALAWDHYLPLWVSPLPSGAPALPEQHAVVDGDALIPSISAASVLAKTVRDGLMERLDTVYPGYGIARHKGYGTKEHLDALAAKGPCPLHRKTFRGVRPEERQLRLL
jgi:ribonuclease HII